MKLTAFFGHTHGGGVTHPLPIVTVETGNAEYGEPDIFRVVSVD